MCARAGEFIGFLLLCVLKTELDVFQARILSSCMRSAVRPRPDVIMLT